MFEAAEIGQRVSKAEYDEGVPKLRVELLTAQYELRKADFQVIVLVAGDDRPGCNELINVLNEWLDTRFLETNTFGEPTDEEQERPKFWRYWRVLPPDGRIGVFTRAWVTQAVRARVLGGSSKSRFERELDHIRSFEQTLSVEGVLLLKLWLHLPKSELKQRLKRAKKRKVGKWWRFGKDELQIYRRYNRGIRIVEQALRETSDGGAPWHIIESTDARYRNLTVGRMLLDAIRRRMSEPPQDESGRGPDEPIEDSHTILDTVDLSVSLAKTDYEKQLVRYQRKLSRLSRRARAKGVSTVLVFEGWDAAGKGGIVRRLTGAMDAEDYRVVPIAAPTEEERVHHYLWRFWRYLPRAGRMTIFDRSWYGRVLVERVEGFASRAEWMRAYTEINQFEEQLVEGGIVLAKFWLHIDPDEQLRRFKARELTPFKKYKITEEDYRNRERWNEYELAVNQMVERTSTELAPWHIVAANSKYHARIEVLRTVCRCIERRL